MYNIFDFKAVTKHSYYGCRGTFDTVTCKETGEKFSSWHAGVNDFLTRYLEPLPDMRSLIVAHDMGRAYRTSFFPEYKQKKNVKPQNPLERKQIELMENWVKKFLAAVGALQIGVEGVEADDVIAWLCKGQEVAGIVYTVDADLLQLVSPTIALQLKGELYTEDMDYKGLPLNVTSVTKSIVGDPSDNYKGIPGMGPAAVQKITDALGFEALVKLEQIAEHKDFPALELMVQENPEVSQLQKILDNWGVWLDQYRLARLHPELCWKPRARKLVKPTLYKRVPDAQKVYDLLEEVGAEDLWSSKFSKMVPGVLAVDNSNWPNVKETIKAELLNSPEVAFDYESTDKNQIEAFKQASTVNFVDVLSQEITGVSFCFGEHFQNVIYISIDHADTNNVPLSELQELMQFIKDNKIVMIAQNAFFEGVLTRKDLGIILDDVYDTRIMQRYYDENSSAGLKTMSKEYLNYDQDSYEKTLNDASETKFLEAVSQSEDFRHLLPQLQAGVDEEFLAENPELLKLRMENRCKTMSDISLEQVVKYGTDDSLVTAHLFDLLKLLLQVDQQWTHYDKWAVNPTQTLQSAFIAGVNINWALQKRLHEKDLKTMETSMTSLRKILEENVTGEKTEGFHSYVKEEKTYMERSFKDKYEDKWFGHYSKWLNKLEEACIYKPFSITEVMPAFAYTPKQLSEAAVAVGLPEIEKITLTYLNDYFAGLGLISTDPVTYEGEQKEFLDALQTAVAQRVDKLKTEETFLRRKAFDTLAEVCQRLAKVEPKLIKVGDELNVGSSAQMRELLYCKIGMPVRLYGTSVGIGRLKLGIKQAGPSTDEKAIQTALAMDSKDGWTREALGHLLKIKQANTRINLFHNKMPLWKHNDGRIHPYITYCGTDTRRPTGSAPNILQIPSRGEGSEMRSMYMPPNEDYVCIAVDFSGQELRIMACETQDPMMLDAYNPENEKDIHSMTGSGIAAMKATKDSSYSGLEDFYEFDLARKKEDHPKHKLADAVRGLAKGCNFGMSYGAAAPTVARNLIIPLEEADEILGGAFKLYARVKPWQEETAKFMNAHGYTLTAFGTKRHATDDLFSADKGKVSRVHRQGTNATIQGTAAEMLKIIQTRLHTEGWLYSLRMEFFAPIYDEIVSWVHKDDAVAYCQMLYTLMSESTPPTHEVPQIPEFSIGVDWGSCHELGRNPTPEAIENMVARVVEEGKEVWSTDMKLTYEEVYG